MRAVLLIAGAVVIALVVGAQFSSVSLPGLARVTCSLPEEACPEVSWSSDIRWANDTPTLIKSFEFRELPPDWGSRRSQIPFEPEWAAAVEFHLEPMQAAACRLDPQGVVCHYIEYGGDPEDLPWYEPTPRERQLAWCWDPENKPAMFLAAYELDLGQGMPVPGADPTVTVFWEAYQEWQRESKELTENLDRACEAAYASR